MVYPWGRGVAAGHGGHTAKGEESIGADIKGRMGLIVEGEGKSNREGAGGAVVTGHTGKFDLAGLAGVYPGVRNIAPGVTKTI